MKKKMIIVVIVLVTLAVIGIGIYLFKNNGIILDDNIPEGYIAVFHGGSGEVTYSTYIYKIDNGKSNYGFEYINTTNTTVSWGSPNWNVEVTKKGKVGFADEVFEVARDNYAGSYVKLPDSNQIYSLEEFANMFLKN